MTITTCIALFLSTLSLRRATKAVMNNIIFVPGFLSTLSLRRATRKVKRCHAADMSISIHALLAESDLMMLLMVVILISFLSTLSLRRATSRAEAIATKICHFYPRSPCGERRGAFVRRWAPSWISIHALLAESDSAPRITPAASRNFYPRSPCGERL